MAPLASRDIKVMQFRPLTSCDGVTTCEDSQSPRIWCRVDWCSSTDVSQEFAVSIFRVVRFDLQGWTEVTVLYPREVGDLNV